MNTKEKREMTSAIRRAQRIAADDAAAVPFETRESLSLKYQREGKCICWDAYGMNRSISPSRLKGLL